MKINNNKGNKRLKCFSIGCYCGVYDGKDYKLLDGGCNVYDTVYQGSHIKACADISRAAAVAAASEFFDSA